MRTLQTAMAKVLITTLGLLAAVGITLDDRDVDLRIDWQADGANSSLA